MLRDELFEGLIPQWTRPLIFFEPAVAGLERIERLVDRGRGVAWPETMA